MASAIEFVYFDLGNVLLSFDPTLACNNVFQRFGVPVDRAREVVYASGLQDRFEHGQVSGEEFAQYVREQLDQSQQSMPSADLLDAVSDMFTPVEKMEGVLQRVRDAGMPVGLLSNTCHAHWDWIKRQSYRVMDFQFDVTILSFEVGSMKPQAEIYEVAERAAGVSPDSILFLDDKQENVAAALDRGWKSQCVLGGEPAIGVLQSLDLLGRSS